MADFNTSNPFDARARHEAQLAESRRRQEAAARGEHPETPVRTVEDMPAPETTEAVAAGPAAPARRQEGQPWDPAGERVDLGSLEASHEPFRRKLSEERMGGKRRGLTWGRTAGILLPGWAAVFVVSALDPFRWSEELLFVAMGVVSAVVLILLAQRAAFKGDARKLQFADRHGWRYRPHKDAGKVALLKEFAPALFGVGHSHEVQDEWWGALQLGAETADAWLAEFQYTTGSGKSATTYRTHAVALRLPRPVRVAFGLTPDAAVIRLLSFLKPSDIDLGDKAFDDAFRIVHGGPKDEAEPALRRLFAAPLRQALLALKEKRGPFSLAARGDTLVVLFFGRDFFPSYGQGDSLALDAATEQAMERDLAALAADLLPVWKPLGEAA